MPFNYRIRTSTSWSFGRPVLWLLVLLLLIEPLSAGGCRPTGEGPADGPFPAGPGGSTAPAGGEKEPAEPAGGQGSPQEPPEETVQSSEPLELVRVLRGMPEQAGACLGLVPATRPPYELSPSGHYLLTRFVVPDAIDAFNYLVSVVYELPLDEDEPCAGEQPARLVEHVYWRLFFSLDETHCEWVRDQRGDILLLGDDHTVFLWDPAGGREILLYSVVQGQPSEEDEAQRLYDCYRGVSESIHGVATSPDGRWAILAIGGLDGRIRLMRFDLRPYLAQLAGEPRLELKVVPLPAEPASAYGWSPLEGDPPASPVLADPSPPTSLCSVEDRRGRGATECFPFQSMDLWWLENGDIGVHSHSWCMGELGHRYWVHHAGIAVLEEVMTDDSRWITPLAGGSYLVLYTCEYGEPTFTEVYTDRVTLYATRPGLWNESPGPGVLIKNNEQGIWMWHLPDDESELAKSGAQYIGRFPDGTWCWLDQVAKQP